MKKFLFLIVMLLSCLVVFAQAPMAVIDSGVNALLVASGIDQYIYYGQQVAYNIESIIQAVATVSTLEQQVKMYAQNMQSIADVENWDDFMDWYNRQLYLERMAIQTFEGMNVKIGSKSYHLTDIEGMAYGAIHETKDYFEEGINDDQRKAMWLEMGLTPSNYAYVEPFRNKARKIAVEGLTARDFQNEWYMRVTQRSNERQRRRAGDKHLADDQKMGQKEVLMDIAESIDELNKVTNDIAMYNAQMLEMQAVKHYLEQSPVDSPILSEWGEDGFKQLEFENEDEKKKK